MICEDCNVEMESISGYDSGSSGEDIAYNLYECGYCGTIKIEHVWKDARVITIPADYNKEIKVELTDEL